MKKSGKIIVAAMLALSLTGIKTYAQVTIKTGGLSDTTTYNLYNSEQNFDSKRTVIIDDKRSVDSLAAVLATQDNKLYRIIYKKENQQARVITSKTLKGMNTDGFYRITIAYNKHDVMDEQKPMYIIASK